MANQDSLTLRLELKESVLPLLTAVQKTKSGWYGSSVLAEADPG